MNILGWVGIGLVLIGLGALGYCIDATRRARKAGMRDGELKRLLQRLMAVNAGALATAASGLMLVVVGLLLG